MRLDTSCTHFFLLRWICLSPLACEERDGRRGRQRELVGLQRRLRCASVGCVVPWRGTAGRALQHDRQGGGGYWPVRAT